MLLFYLCTFQIQELSKQIEDSAIQLDGQISEINAKTEDGQEKLNQGLANVKDELGRKILDSANDLSLKYDEKLDNNAQLLNKQFEEKLDNKLLDVKMGLDEIEKNIADALENEKVGREKLADDTKMALEEEKMLRAQDIGIIRLKSFFPPSVQRILSYLKLFFEPSRNSSFI